MQPGSADCVVCDQETMPEESTELLAQTEEQLIIMQAAKDDVLAIFIEAAEAWEADKEGHSRYCNVLEKTDRKVVISGI